MVLRIPESGLQLASSAKSADTLPLQAFALTLSDTLIEDLIQCVENGEDIKLSLGNVPSILYGKDVHKISKASETTDLDLYLTDSSESTQHAERLPHPTMSLFIKPQLHRYPKLAAGRQVAREKTASKTSAAGRKTQHDLPDDVEALRINMEKAKNEKKENSTTILDASMATGAKRGTKGSNKKLHPGKTGGMTGTIGRSAPASPALSGIVSPSMGPTLSAAEHAKEEARELRAPIVHELAIREMSFEDLRSRWPGDSEDFKPALDKVADFDNTLQKYALKKLYWKELDVFKYDYDSDEDRQKAIDNAVKMYDRMRMGASEPLWDKLLPKEERGKGKCLSKLLPTIAKGAPQPAAKTPQIKVNDAEDSSGSKHGDGSQSGSEKKTTTTKKTSQPMSRSSSQTKAPAKKIERKWVGKKAATPKVSPTKAGGKSSKDKGGRVLSKEFISDSDSSSEEAPLSKIVQRSKEKEERERQMEKEKHLEKEKQQREREREKDRLLEKQKEKEAAAVAAASKPKPKPSAAKEIIKSQVIARPMQKRPREEADDDSSSSSGTPLSKRVNREIKATAPAQGAVSYKRPPSDSSSQSSSRSNSYVGPGYSSKNKNTSPVKSSPLASSPPTNASDLDQRTLDETRHERERDRSRDRSVTVANSTINVKKRKMELDGDVIDVAVAEKKRQRLSTTLLNDARTFKKCYDAYQRLHYELSGGGSFSQEKYDTLLRQRKRLEGLKASIYAQIPRECY